MFNVQIFTHTPASNLERYPKGTLNFKQVYRNLIFYYEIVNLGTVYIKPDIRFIYLSIC